MEIFIAWAGSTSKQIASIIHQWIPMVLQSVSPWMSDFDVDKGRRWERDLSEKLALSNVGLVCLTPDNLNSTWIHFESGALAKSVEQSRLWTFLYHLKPSDVPQPLGVFQHTTYERPDVYKLIQSINSQIDKPLVESQLSVIFDIMWPKLEEMMAEVKANVGSKSDQRTDREILDEMLNTVRTLSQRIDQFDSQTTFSITERNPILIEFYQTLEYIKSIQMMIENGDEEISWDNLNFLSEQQNQLRDFYRMMKSGLHIKTRDKLAGEIDDVVKTTNKIRGIREKRIKQGEED